MSPRSSRCTRSARSTCCPTSWAATIGTAPRSCGRPSAGSSSWPSRLARARRQSPGDDRRPRPEDRASSRQELTSTRDELATGLRVSVRAARPAGTEPRRAARRAPLAAARARLHALEADNQRLQALLGVLADVTPLKPRPAPEAGAGRRRAGAAAVEAAASSMSAGGASFAAASARPRRGVQRLPAAPRRRPGGDAALAGRAGRSRRRGVLPDRLREPPGVPQGQVPVPAPRQALRAAAQQQRDLLLQAMKLFRSNGPPQGVLPS